MTILVKMRRYLETGDIILFNKRPGVITNRIITGQQYSHAAIICGDYLVESTQRYGTRWIQIDKRLNNLKKGTCVYACLIYPRLSQDVNDRLITAAKEYFPYPGLYNMYKNIPAHHCMAHVSYILQQSGIIGTQLNNYSSIHYICNIYNQPTINNKYSLPIQLN